MDRPKVLTFDLLFQKFIGVVKKGALVLSFYVFRSDALYQVASDAVQKFVFLSAAYFHGTFLNWLLKYPDLKVENTHSEE